MRNPRIDQSLARLARKPMSTIATIEELRESVRNSATAFTNLLVEGVVEAQQVERADEWIKEKGSVFLRQALSAALSLRAERQSREAPCECGGVARFRQHRPYELHTVVPGRDVWLDLPYAVCRDCHKSVMPLLKELRSDAEGFTPALRELALLAVTKEPYEEAAETTLPRFAGVDVSRDKLQSLVREYAPAALATMQEPLQDSLPLPATGALYLGLDGGMVFVEKAWQEIKLAVLFHEDAFVSKGPTDRGVITARHVSGVRGSPEELETLLTPLAHALGDREVVVLGDGARWIWNLVDRLFPNRTEILDWYHVDEHVSHVAQLLFGEGTLEAQRWRASQLEHLAHDEAAHVLTGLRFLLRSRRKKVARDAISALHDYLEANQARIRYATFKARGLRVGSGFIESAINHVVQHRMKRTGMRWRAVGADAVLALRCVLRTTGGWPRMLTRSLSTGTG